MIRKGDIVRLKIEYQDDGDSDIQLTAMEDEDGGRVKIQHQVGLPINPVSVVTVDMLESNE